MEVGSTGQIAPLHGHDLRSLETVRALHQTVVSLRAALEQSRAELHSLRSKFQTNFDPAIYTSTIEKLSLENHVLRQRALSASHGNLNAILDVPGVRSSSHGNLNAILDAQSSSHGNLNSISNIPRARSSSNGNLNAILDAPKQSMEPGTDQAPPDKETELEELEELDGYDERDEVFEDIPNGEEKKAADEDPSTDKPKITKGESEDSEEVDDIELIFTTGDTKELSALQEDLVSIAESETWPQKSGGGNDCENNRKRWTHSVLVETDISKCGIFDENDEPIPDSQRRYTLPDPAPHRPIIRTLSGSRSQLLEGGTASPRPLAVKFMQHNKQRARPILVEKETSKQESEAQTDITALPAHWRSESYLAHKVSYQFTTLPSKFAFPVQTPPRKHSLKLCEKTQEARRVLLSDINFTSMVPELSRSADHLCNEGINASVLCKNYPRAFSYMKNPDSMMSPAGRNPWSPCECNCNAAQMSSWDSYRGGSSMSMMQSPSALDLVEHQTRRRHSMRPSTSSTDTCWGSVTSRANWSVPSSPTHCRRSRSIPLNQTPGHPDSSHHCCGGGGGGFGSAHTRRSDSRFLSSSSSCTRGPFRKARNRVTFQESRSRRPGQSLPDLRLPLDVMDSGEDSTDSLIEESEDFLRKSIDSMLTGADYSHVSRRRKPRRHSDPDPIRELEPPKWAQPFLARVPRDLKLDYWVKVITGEGRVVVGRVKYVGPLPGGRSDAHVGVRLPRADGNSDGTVDGRRFFDCEPDHAIFVPFKKVVMAWSN